jgi:hypothetical protein
MRDIKVLHLEPTDVCQAACSQCARETDTAFDKRQQHHLDMWKILQVFDADRVAKLDKMFMCGVYGDPAAGKHTLNIYREFRKLNPQIVLGMNTNGALQNTLWWHELGTMFNQSQDYVVFSIDGLESTNNVYRRGVDWRKLMFNAQAFVEAGGSAHWDMLVYRHNQHQVEECEQLAKSLGFKWFRAKVSKRGFDQVLQAPTGWNIPSKEMGTISCHALKEQSMYIDAQGLARPCCWLSKGAIDFDEIQRSWTDSNPNTTCASTCGTVNQVTAFESQWQRTVQLS